MSALQEHDYIGLSELDAASDKLSSSDVSTENEKNKLKETELRLGLPGLGLSLFGKDLEESEKSVGGFCASPFKNFASSGAKRGFSDAIDGSSNWGLSVKVGSEVDLSRGGVDGVLEKNGAQKLGFTGANFSPSLKVVEEKKVSVPAPKAQVVGWPPIRSFRKNTIATNLTKKTEVVEPSSGSGCLYVKVSMDGAPYLRKVDLKTYCNYTELSSALEKMFSCFTIGKCTSNGLPEREGLSASRLKDLVHGSEYVLSYEDKDGDWMLVGDVPWDMFTDSCKRLRIMKGSEAIGLAPRTMDKCENHRQ
ncbi:hypothetical protein DCAR_0208554 [Daucus carota subsp. sativus]|uniref:Auxin-responsive protein n=1 Tax=Daucus carota subsp. sativus TaxID=79200 RepID=A0A166ELP6_DAUCS|nr:PREDICTED: auxin-responsive protein IAA27-like [Daucus carota subsp. sativus]WOG89316.1 hypothetical protein DCAR_0208554 [Daucus carota subsp. sativus]